MKINSLIAHGNITCFCLQICVFGVLLCSHLACKFFILFFVFFMFFLDIFAILTSRGFENSFLKIFEKVTCLACWLFWLTTIHRARFHESQIREHIWIELLWHYLHNVFILDGLLHLAFILDEITHFDVDNFTVSFVYFWFRVFLIDDTEFLLFFNLRVDQICLQDHSVATDLIFVIYAFLFAHIKDRSHCDWWWYQGHLIPILSASSFLIFCFTSLGKLVPCIDE